MIFIFKGIKNDSKYVGQPRDKTIPRDRAR